MGGRLGKLWGGAGAQAPGLYEGHTWDSIQSQDMNGASLVSRW